MMLTGHLNATRFAQKPLPQPTYNFRNVPKAERDLKGSSLQYLDERDAFHTCMAEMLLLCKEAMRRRPSSKVGGKPLSLEYLADRFDIDDPVFGFLVRTKDNLDNAEGWQKGMLQGFVTITTFTNYQKSFRWDSHNEAAFSYDDENLAIERASGERKWDADASLAAGMQATVRCGDIWNEGIVWPRIAEISLLGGLGCGSSLVSLAIEHLECMKASGKCNYDYVVLQATDNSVSFYESMGFVRVGAVIKDERGTGSSSSDGEDAAAEHVDENSPENPDAVATPVDIVTSELTSHKTKKAGETPADVAKKCNVDVWDIVFLNKDVYNGIAPTSRLLAGTVLHIPVITKPEKSKAKEVEVPQWYVASENETPRTIARKFDINCLDLVEANKGRLTGLMSNSRLKGGTRVKVSHLDVHEGEYQPYAHWSFPDDQFEDGEPSYMMALKLNRRRGRAASYRPFESSLATQISKYEPTALVMPPSPHPVQADIEKASPARHRNPKRRHHGEPQSPKRPLCAYMLYAAEQREKRRDELDGMTVPDVSKHMSDLWRELADSAKAKYERAAAKARDEYATAKAQYERDLQAYKLRNPTCADATGPVVPVVTFDGKQSLYNKVVRLKPGAMTEGSEYTYWYVLTYIPDLKWCHLAPMIQAGTFGADRGKIQGRPKWRLVDEKLCKEVDISASFCIPVKSRAVRKTLDADKEEWDVIDDGSDPYESTSKPSSRGGSMASYDSDDSPDEDRPVRFSTAVKPSTERKRKRGSMDTKRLPKSGSVTATVGLPRLLAAYPGKHTFYVKLLGERLYDPAFDYPVKRKVGRPRGRTFKAVKKAPKPTSIAVNALSVAAVAAADGLRKRGRPKGSKNKPKAHESLDSLSARFTSGEAPAKSTESAFPVFETGVAEPKRKRGRPKGSKIKKKVLTAVASPLDSSKATERRPPRSTAKLPKQLLANKTLCGRLTSPRRPHKRVRLSSPTGGGAFEEASSSVGSLVAKTRSPTTSSRMKSLSRSSARLRSPLLAENSRPKRMAAPSYLGESPGTPGRSMKMTAAVLVQKRPEILDSPSSRTRTKSETVSIIGELPRKRRKVNNAGSRRTVLQG